MAKSDEPRVARPRCDDWPKELGHLRSGLIVRSVLFTATMFVVAVGVWVFLWTVVLRPLAEHVQSVVEQWWGVDVARAVSVGIYHGTGALLIVTAMNWCTRARTRYYSDALLLHGHCPCGYKCVEQGIIRSCPECGRKWTVKEPPPEQRTSSVSEWVCRREPGWRMAVCNRNQLRPARSRSGS
jgi:hypothetical protein